MVGVPRSTGCTLCRTRRVKCDGTRPACGNCQRYGAECPGYERGLKFVTGKHQICQRSSRKVSRSPDDGSLVLLPRKQAVNVVEWTPEALQLTTRVAPSLAPNRGQSISTILEQLRPSISQYEVFGLFSWIQLERLGDKAALDGAMCSLTLHLFGKETRDETMLAQSRTMYGQSLNALRAVLQHPKEWKTSETLCSAIILCIFELFAGTVTSETWLQHARGIGTLMEQRGASAHKDGWDAAMVLPFRGVLIMSEMFYPTESGCFMARKEWKGVLRDGGRGLYHPIDMKQDLVELFDDFFEHLAGVPGILKYGYMLKEARAMGINVTGNRIAYLRITAAEKHQEFQVWYKKIQEVLGEPRVVNTNLPDSPYPTVFHYDAAWAGSMHMAYWASMLILEETLALCQWPEDFEQSKKDNVKNILRSIECVSKGTMGPYRVGFSIRIAYEFASVEAQNWLRGLLDGFSKTFAATNKETYPKPRIDQGGYN